MINDDGKDQQGARVGFTVTKRIGNAVIRNRIKRRFREMVGENAGSLAITQIDYVVIARQGAEIRRFKALNEDFKLALKRVHGKLGKQHKVQKKSENEIPNRDPSP